MTQIESKIDQEKLDKYLSENIDGFHSLSKFEKFAGGQSNPTFLLEAASGKYVLRSKPQGELLKGAHAVDREYTVINALKNTNVPVAKPFHFCDDESIMGSVFYVMEFKKGRVFWDPRLPEISCDKERAEIYNEMNRVLAELHSVDVFKVGLEGYGKTTDYYARQIHVWSRQYRFAETDKIEAAESLMEWLPENIPSEDGKLSLVHGDYRLDNMIFHPSEPKIIALVDWELSTLGHPFADLAYQCAQWRLPDIPMLRSFGSDDRVQYNIPSEEKYIRSYCQRMGLEKIENWDFYLAFSLFRLTSIIQGVKKRSIDGNASSAQAHKIGEKVNDIAATALEIALAGKST